MEQTLQTLSQKSATAKAIRYPLVRWEALGRYCDDGRIEIDNNAAARALRCVALGRNYADLRIMPIWSSKCLQVDRVILKALCINQSASNLARR
jgi:hypothetical protein